MKTLNLSQTLMLNNPKSYDHFKLWFKIILIQCLVLLLIILAVGLLSRVNAQAGTDKENVLTNNNSGINIAAFASELPQAEMLSSYINSTFKEIGPLVTPDGRTLFFSRQNHPGNTGGILDHEDIWYSKYNDITGMWSMPDRMASPINNSGPNSVNFVSLTGDTLILMNHYSKHGRMSSGLSMSIFENGKWSFPNDIKLKEPIDFSDHFNLSISYNKQVAMTSEERLETYGSDDVYVSLLGPDGSRNTFNLGSVINTDQEESSPFLAPDYKTLYFASKGHNGFGGLDIFVSHRLDETWQNWSEPENLGPAVNSANDEEFFNFTFDGQYAYFSREVSAENSDIFRVSLSGLYKYENTPIKNNIKYRGLVQTNSNIDSMGLGDIKISRLAKIEE